MVAYVCFMIPSLWVLPMLKHCWHRSPQYFLETFVALQVFDIPAVDPMPPRVIPVL